MLKEKQSKMGLKKGVALLLLLLIFTNLAGCESTSEYVSTAKKNWETASEALDTASGSVVYERTLVLPEREEYGNLYFFEILYNGMECTLVFEETEFLCVYGAEESDYALLASFPYALAQAQAEEESCPIDEVLEFHGFITLDRKDVLGRNNRPN